MRYCTDRIMNVWEFVPAIQFGPNCRTGAPAFSSRFVTKFPMTYCVYTILEAANVSQQFGNVTHIVQAAQFDVLASLTLNLHVVRAKTTVFYFVFTRCEQKNVCWKY